MPEVSERLRNGSHSPAAVLKTLAVLGSADVVFPGWMPFGRFAVAQDVQGSIRQVEEIRKLDGDTLVGWAVFDDYIDRVALKCVDTLTPKWQTKLAAFDVWIWDQCYAREQSPRIE
jgi:hypothetical protein